MAEQTARQSSTGQAASTGPAPRLWRDASGRVDVKSFDLPALERFFVDELGEPVHRARQVYKQLWQQGARTFEEMDDVAKSCRATLARVAYVSFLEPDMVLPAADGTVKYLWRLEDGHTVESVLIPDKDRLTLCMSSQVGCAMACTFCLTGDLGLKRHLKPSEIANQPLQVGRQLMAETGRSEILAGRRITNLVLMGMGEPLHNLDNLVVALDNALHDHALGFSHRKVTVSTVGLVSKMHELAERLPVNLAVSLNATTEGHRRRIMPITRKHSMAELLEACRTFPLPANKRITFEYVMFRGANDTLEDAERLFELLRGIKAKVNLIPYNENPDRDLRRPDDETVSAFQDHLVRKGLSTSVRATRGEDISAACGQLGKMRQQVEQRGWLDDARSIAGLPPR